MLSLVSPVDFRFGDSYSFTLSVSIIDLQLVVIGYLVGLHELFDGGFLIPATSKNFISAHMNNSIREKI